jgi:hypothetical protein
VLYWYLVIKVTLQQFFDTSLSLLGGKGMMVKSEESSRLEEGKISVERVQIGVRMEKRMVKVLKALAEYHDISLGDLLEGIVLHAFENVTPFGEETLQRIAQLKEVYGMNYDVSASHRFTEQTPGKDDRNGE